MKRGQHLRSLSLDLSTGARRIVEELQSDGQHLSVDGVERYIVGNFSSHENDVVREGEVGVVRENEVRLGECRAGLVLGERSEEDGRGGGNWF